MSPSFVQRERLPNTLPASCLGEACLYFSGTVCSAYEKLLEADVFPARADEPPYRDLATYAIYGVVCGAGAGAPVVDRRLELLQPDAVSVGKLLALLAKHGELSLGSQ